MVASTEAVGVPKPENSSKEAAAAAGAGAAPTGAVPAGAVPEGAAPAGLAPVVDKGEDELLKGAIMQDIYQEAEKYKDSRAESDDELPDELEEITQVMTTTPEDKENNRRLNVCIGDIVVIVTMILLLLYAGAVTTYLVMTDE